MKRENSLVLADCSLKFCRIYDVLSTKNLMNFSGIHFSKHSRREEAFATEEIPDRHRDAPQCDQEEDLPPDPWSILRPAHWLISRYFKEFGQLIWYRHEKS